MNKEIAITVGYNASGKSTFVQKLVDQGYQRINRDIAGGSLQDQVVLAEDALLNGVDKVVLDNTYPTVKSRAGILALGKKLNINVVCLWMQTSFEDAQLNACLRMMKKLGTIPNPEDFKNYNDPNTFPVAALYACRKEFEPPTLPEGFHAIDRVPFIRKWGAEYKNKALFLDYDGTLRLSSGKQKYPTKPSEIKMMPGRREKILEYANKGYILLGVSNQSGVAKRSITAQDAHDCFQATNKLLGVDIDYKFCPHNVPPIACWCRKPNVGMAAIFIEKYKLLPSQCLMVGDMGSDKSFAQRCGIPYMDQSLFFK